MSAIYKLNDFYYSFFNKVKDFSISPYRSMFVKAEMDPEFGQDYFYDPSTGKEEWGYGPYAERDRGTNQAVNDILGICACIVLTIIPVLPALTMLTMGLAVTGFLLGVLSMAISFPVASCIDACNARVSP